MTEHGCLPQYTCDACHGYLNKRCYPGAVQMNDGDDNDDSDDGDYGSTPAPAPNYPNNNYPNNNYPNNNYPKR
jgi:hypothetical protein